MDGSLVDFTQLFTTDLICVVYMFYLNFWNLECMSNLFYILIVIFSSQTKVLSWAQSIVRQHNIIIVTIRLDKANK